MPITLLLLSLRRAWCVLRSFERRLNSPTRGRVARRLKVSNADIPVCARGRTAFAYHGGGGFFNPPLPLPFRALKIKSRKEFINVKPLTQSVE